MSRPSRFSPEQKAREVRMVLEGQSEYPSQWAAIESVAAKVVVSSETLRKWVRQVEVDGGQRPGLTSEEAAEVKRPRREVAELRRANEILKAAAALSGPSSTGHNGSRELHRREQKDRTDGGRRWGVESICRVLCEQDMAIAPATYYAAKTRAPSARAVRDEGLKALIVEVNRANYEVYAR